MQKLTLRGVHDDEVHLVLSGEDGTQFLLPIDETLFAAVRRDRARLAQIQASSGSARPKDIQAMIRSGMSAEEVAEDTGSSIEHVRSYERPVLAERANIARLAGKALVYPENNPDRDPKPLLELCHERLAMRDVSLDTMEWDAWRKSDGHWYVELTFVAGNRPRNAGWTFHRGSITPEDDEARWLSDAGPSDTGPIPSFGSASERVFNIEAEDSGHRVEESPGAPVPGTRRNHEAETGRILENLRRRRGRPAASGDQPEAISGHGNVVPEGKVSRHGVLHAVQVDKSGFSDDPDRMPGAHNETDHEEDEAEVFALNDRKATLDDQLPLVDENQYQSARFDTQPIGDDEELAGGQSNDSGKLTSKDPHKKAKRSSVPSWDEIMFGGKRD